MSVKDAAAGFGLDPAFEGFADDKVRQRNNSCAKRLSAGKA